MNRNKSTIELSSHLRPPVAKRESIHKIIPKNLKEYEIINLHELEKKNFKKNNLTSIKKVLSNTEKRLNILINPKISEANRLKLIHWLEKVQRSIHL